jgi:putative ABC transport system permease protein
VALGVASVFALALVKDSVVGAFQSSVRRLSGSTTWVIGEGGGLDEELLEPLRAVPGVAVAAPVIQESVRDVGHQRSLMVMAVDTVADDGVRDYEVQKGDAEVEDDLAFLNDPRGVLVSHTYAAAHGLSIGDVLTLDTPAGRASFNVRGLLTARGAALAFGGDLLVMDVYAAQIAFERGRRFDRVDVVATEGTESEALRARLAAVLAGRAKITRPGQRGEDVERMLATFSLGLTLASVVGLFVGGFIVYNALAIAVAQRRREIGILRALGATRGQVRVLFVGEGLVFGVLGAALGVLLGALLGRAALVSFGDTISDLFLAVRADALSFSHDQLALALGMGLCTALAASYLPARSASEVEPVAAMAARSEASIESPRARRRWLRTSLALGLTSLTLAAVAHGSERVDLGALAMGGFMLSCALAAPSLTRGVARSARRLTRRSRPALRLGVIGFERNARRNAVAVAALGLALANLVQIASFLVSMRQSTNAWLERTLRADLVVFAGEKVQARFEHPLPEALGERLSELSGAVLVDPFRMVRQHLHGRPFYLFSYELDAYRKYTEIPVVAGDLDEAMRAIEAGTGIAANETFAREFAVGLGDTLVLDTPSGPHTFRVALLYADYSADLGILTTTRAVYRTLWKDPLVDSFNLYLRDRSQAAAVRDRLAATLSAERQLLVLSNADYKREVVSVFARSFGLMRAMELVALAIALLGIVNTLIVSVIDRTRELGILRALGCDAVSLMRMLVVEALLIGTSAALFGLAVGLPMAAYSVKELLRFQLGWRVPFQVDAEVVVEALLAALLVAALGALYPARRATRAKVVDALHSAS